MIKAIIFDLDDTLYYELDYVKSGFRAVSNYMNTKYGVPVDEFYQELLNILELEGRGKTFDLGLKNFSLPEKEVKKMLEVYRSHLPEKIRLYKDAENMLNKLKKNNEYKTGVITDGNSLVQWSKIRSLGLEELVDEIIVTDDFGIENRKPNIFSYQKLLGIFKVKAEEAVYIGDNPVKDFITAKKLGMKTIRVMRKQGMHVNKRMEEAYEADYEVDSLKDLDQYMRKL